MPIMHFSDADKMKRIIRGFRGHMKGNTIKIYAIANANRPLTKDFLCIGKCNHTVHLLI